MPRVPEQTKHDRKERVLMLLNRHPDGLTEREIADMLNLERRTTHNYLHELDLEARVIKEGQHWLPAPFQAPVLRRFELTPEGAVVLYLAVRLFVKQSDQRSETAETVLLRLAEVLASDMGLEDNIVRAAQELAQRPVLPGYEDIFKAIARSYIYRCRVEIVYQPYRGKAFTTLFAPYLLEPSAIGFSTYAIGHSSVVNDLRTYKLERIQQAVLRPRDTYQIPDTFPGLELLRNAWSIYYGEDTVIVTLRFDPSVVKRVQETQWHPSQVFAWDEEKPGHLLVTFQVADTTDLVPWIRTWGANCEVIAPESLRDALTGEARRLAHLYGWHVSTPSGDRHARFDDIFGGQ